MADDGTQTDSLDSLFNDRMSPATNNSFGKDNLAELFNDRTPPPTNNSFPNAQKPATQPQSSTPQDPLIFKALGYKAIQNAPNYESAVTGLKNAYTSSKWTEDGDARAALDDLSKVAMHQFGKDPSVINPLTSSPYPASAFQSTETDPYKKGKDIVDQWEDHNLRFLDTTSDPDYLSVKHPLETRIKQFASQARVDLATGSDKGGTISWLKNLGIHALGSAFDPISKLESGAPTGIMDYASEKEKGIGTKIADVAGGIAPVITAGALSGGIGSYGMMGLYGTAATTDMYQETLDATGDPHKAAIAASIMGGTQLATGIPAASIVQGAVKKATTEAITNELAPVAAKEALKGAAEFGAIGAAQQLGSNVAVRQGINQDQPYTAGLGESIVSNALVGGLLKGAPAALQRMRTEKALDALGIREPAKKSAPVEKAPQQDTPVYQANLDIPELRVVGESIPPQASKKNTEAQNALYPQVSEVFHAEPPADEDTANMSYDAVQPDDFLAKNPDAVIGAAPDVIQGQVDFSKTPGRVAWAYMKALFGRIPIETRETLAGKLGYLDIKNGTINLPRSIGSNPTLFMKVLWHEMRHANQLQSGFIGNETPLETMINRVRSFSVQDIAQTEARNKDAIEASQAWRPGWDGNTDTPYGAYRARPEEIDADVMGSLATDPDRFKNAWPELYNAIDKGMTEDPAQKASWEELKAFWQDPNRLSNWKLEQEGQSYKMMGDIEAERRASAQVAASKTPWSDRVKQFNTSFVQWAFRRDTRLQSIAKALEPGPLRDELFRNISLINSPQYAKIKIKYALAKTASNFADEIEAQKINPDEAQLMLKNTQMMDEETPTTYQLRKNPQGMMPGVRALIAALERIDPQHAANLYRAMDNPSELTDTLAQTLFRLSTKPVDDSDQRTMGAKTPPENKVTPNLEMLQKEINNLDASKADKALAQKLADPKSYNIRRYLLNPQGDTIHDAYLDDAAQRSRLGNQYEALKQIVGRYYDGLSPAYDAITSSETISPELKERIALNKRAYATTAVLKYFSGDDSVRGSFKSAIGTLDEKAQPAAATVLKLAASANTVFENEKNNAIIRFADTTGQKPEKVDVPYQQSVWDQQAILQKRDPENTYVVQTLAGKTALYKLTGKDWKALSASSDSGDFLNKFGDLVQASRNLLLTRETKTIFSPTFGIGLRGRNVRQEAFAAGSLYPTLGFWHLDPKLRAMEKAVKADINSYLETGVPSGAIQEALDKNILPGYLFYHGDSESTLSGIADPLYRMMGTTNLPKDIGSKTEAINSKVADWLRRIGLFNLHPFEWAEHKAFKEEFRGKVMGLLIGKSLGMGDYEAADFARKNFGTPDIYGGGTGAGTFNKFVLFGKVHLNEIAAQASLMQNLGPKNTGYQIATRVVLPKLLMNKYVGTALVGSMFGEEAKDIYDKYLDYIPTFEKMTKNVIPVGWMTPENEFRWLFQVDPKELNHDYKAAYFRLPQAPSVSDISMLMWPAINDMLDGHFGAVPKDIGTGAWKASGNWSTDPILQYGINIAKTAFGYTPMDSFRDRPLLSKDEVAAGNESYVQKGYNLAKVTGKSAARELSSSILPTNLFSYGDNAVSSLKHMAEGEPKATDLLNVPFAGNILRSLIGVQNYGLAEKDAAIQEAKNNTEGYIRENTGAATQEMMNVYKHLSHEAEGKGTSQLSPDERTNYNLLRSWKNSYYDHAFNELKNDYPKNDSEGISFWNDELERQAELTRNSLRGR